MLKKILNVIDRGKKAYSMDCENWRKENYDYRMKRLIKKFVKDYELENLNAEELQDKLWDDYSKEFARAVLEDMQEFSGDELFENVTE